jgi:hypothetical protein
MKIVVFIVFLIVSYFATDAFNIGLGAIVMLFVYPFANAYIEHLMKKNNKTNS